MARRKHLLSLTAAAAIVAGLPGCTADVDQAPDEVLIDAAIAYVISNERAVMVIERGPQGLHIRTEPALPHRSVSEFKALNPGCCIVGHIPSDAPVPGCVARRGVSEVSLRYNQRYRAGSETRFARRTIHLGVDRAGKVCAGELVL